MPNRVVLNRGAIAALATDPAIFAGVGEVADAVVVEEARRAPKDSGEGAASIHKEENPDRPGGYRVGWDEDHFYLTFRELGTEHEPAVPFARPTADEFNSRR